MTWKDLIDKGKEILNSAGNGAIKGALNSATANEAKESAFQKFMNKYWPLLTLAGFLLIVGLFSLFTRKKY